jgi:hypothetical protein
LSWEGAKARHIKEPQERALKPPARVAQ